MEDLGPQSQHVFYTEYKQWKNTSILSVDVVETINFLQYHISLHNFRTITLPKEDKTNGHLETKLLSLSFFWYGSD